MIGSPQRFKRQAAELAATHIRSGMVVGLGTGSTAVHLVRALGRMLADGALRDIVGIPTSEATAAEAQRCGVPLSDFEQHPRLDLTVDGADEVDPNLDLIKGLGGALLREKIVASVSDRVIIIGDSSKRVSQLGSRAPVPVEVVPFARQPVAAYLSSLRANPVLRPDNDTPDQPFITDEGNIILDCHVDPIADPLALAQAIRNRPGVVEHGLFLGLATHAILVGPDGVFEMKRKA